MKMFSFARALTLTTLACLALPVACGDDDDSSPMNPPVGGSDAGGEPGNTPTPEGGAGGAAPGIVLPGTGTTSKTITCGDDDMCKSTPTLLPTLFVDPCCAADKSCGVSTTFMA